jgi:hypothetical protein
MPPDVRKGSAFPVLLKKIIGRLRLPRNLGGGASQIN